VRPAIPFEDPLSPKPPDALGDREAFVSLDAPNTLVVPCDPTPKIPDVWFDEGLRDGKGEILSRSEGNEVTYLIDADCAYGAMVKAIKTATTSDHFIYLTGWWLSDDFPLVRNQGRTSIGALFASADVKGVQIRAMLWDFQDPLTKNTAEVERINTLKNGAAILDNRHLNFGSHHQKILVVYGTEGLIAFCGGLDINPDRAYGTGETYNKDGDTAGCPMHDVHCRIRGRGAGELLKIFVQRWEDHPMSEVLESDPSKVAGGRGKEKLRCRKLPPPSFAGRQYVQIGRTFGNGSIYGGIDGIFPTHLFPDPTRLEWPGEIPQPASSSDTQEGRYDFAPCGERSAKWLILNAISEAEKFIYVEDQYLTELDVRDQLMETLAKDSFRHLIALIPADDVTLLGLQVSKKEVLTFQLNVIKEIYEQAGINFMKKVVIDIEKAIPRSMKHLLERDPVLSNEAKYRRQQFIRPLKEKYPDKVHVFVLGPPKGRHTYVHAKMWIMDDEFAIIGSVNINRRSLTHDSEVTAGICDQVDGSTRRWTFGHHFAHRLRVALWAEHLGMDDPEGHAELADAVASAVHWLRPPKSARIMTYDHTQPVDLAMLDELQWYLVDPVSD
jgi:phosphatidylserine/phosphatidylglycerophosphate/cardiolipin synthase-like enzyme